LLTGIEIAHTHRSAKNARISRISSHLGPVAMKSGSCKLGLAFAVIAVVSWGIENPALGAVLFTPPGDGSLSVGVDAYGSFGSSVGGVGTSDLVYNPVGALGPAGTTFQSGLAIGFGGSRTFLTTGNIGGSGGLADPGFVTTTPTQATSSFSFGGLSFALTQVVSELSNAGGDRIGSQLRQDYSITNNTAAAISFDLVRYIDGDLAFDGSIADGGGLLNAGGNTVYFETDAGGGGSAATTFVGVLLAGGETPSDGAFDVRSFSGLRSSVVSGAQLLEQVLGDTDGDGFIDPGNEYDVTLAVRRLFQLDPGETVGATTFTFAGSGPPVDVIPSPEPMAVLSWVLVMSVGAVTAKCWQGRRRGRD
jgi:hypothetical protein